MGFVCPLVVSSICAASSLVTFSFFHIISSAISDIAITVIITVVVAAVLVAKVATEVVAVAVISGLI